MFPSISTSSTLNTMSVWTISFLVVTLVEGLIITAFESYVFAKYALSVPQDQLSQPANRTIPTYLALFIFAFLFDIALSYDAIRLQNTIQVIGLNFFQVAMLIYSAIQIEQIHDAILATQGLHFDPWPVVHPFLIAVPCVISLALTLLVGITWKLFEEFGWKIYKVVGASVQMRRRYLTYQIFISLLKFDFFFFLGYEIQSLVIIISITDAEFGLTIAAIPITIAILLFCGWSVRHESKYGMAATIFCFFGGLAYFLFKLVRMYQPSQAWKYIPARRPLTTFAVITVILIVCTIVNAIMCMMNFEKGLKDHILSNKRLSTGGGSSVPMGKLSRRSPPEDDVVNPKTNYLYPKKPSSRMVIE